MQLRAVAVASLLSLTAVAVPGATRAGTASERPAIAKARKAKAVRAPTAAKPRPTRKAARAAYAGRVASLERTRAELAGRLAKAKTEADRRSVRHAARAALLDAVTNAFFPAWEGTAWDFHGTTTTPGAGKIACGYYVTTVLRDAGFQLERAKLAQQPSERIVKTLAPESDVWRFRKGDRDEVLAKVRAEGEGLYVVGLDNHVGFLLEQSGSPTRFCHASYDPPEVRCEDAAKAKVFSSKYHVVGRVLSATALARWVEGRAFETVKP
jgi:hypothetical protein